MRITIPATIVTQVESEGADVVQIVRAAMRPYAIRIEQAKLDLSVDVATREAAETDARAADARMTAARDQAEADAAIAIEGIK